ncbi:MAG: hypothetical protein PSV16_13610 [Flavobacterium sp.]|nr:hypothetical protein [Flavobacterium sp.]
MKTSFWEKYKAFVVFIVVFAIAFFGTRALLSMPKKDKTKTKPTTEKVTDTTTINTTK